MDVLWTVFVISLSLAVHPRVSAASAPSGWNSLDFEQCRNIRGVNERCVYGQFCSKDPVQQGCRNCTDDGFHLKWCEHDPQRFQLKYPSCAVFCEKELWRRELSTQKKDADFDFYTLLAIIVLLVIVAVVTMAIALHYRRKYKKVQNTYHTAGSAVPDTFCCSLTPWMLKLRLGTRTPTAQTDDRDLQRDHPGQQETSALQMEG